MSAFGERLRVSVPEAAAQTALLEPPRRPPQPMSKEECQAAERRYADAEAAAETLVHEVFRPLLEEFQEIMESGGVLLPGRLQEGRIPCGRIGAIIRPPAPPIRHAARPPCGGTTTSAFRRRPSAAGPWCSRSNAATARRGPAASACPARRWWSSISAAFPAKRLTTTPRGSGCAGLLEQCAQACRDANSSVTSSPAAAAAGKIA